MSEISTSPGPAGARHFRRSEHALSHMVYGLILAVATLGELIRHEVDALEAAAGLYLVGIVLLAAHLFSDVFARLLAEERMHLRGVLQIGYNDLAVAAGGVIMGTTMLIAHLVDADASGAMTACLIGALGWLGIQTFFALHRHRVAIRVLMSVVAVLLASVIVALENLH